MSQIVDKINNSEYIYSTITKWGLKKYSCNVAYYTEEPLDDLYYVICSILATNEGQYDKRSLGIILGFSMTDFEKEGKHEMYYDVAEVRMFEDILKKVEEEHLIKINETEHLIILTKLGEISLKHLKHYQFLLERRMCTNILCLNQNCQQPCLCSLSLMTLGYILHCILKSKYGLMILKSKV